MGAWYTPISRYCRLSSDPDSLKLKSYADDYFRFNWFAFRFTVKRYMIAVWNEHQHCVFLIGFVLVVGAKWPIFFRRHFPMCFLQWKNYRYWLYFHLSLFLMVQLTIIQHYNSSGNGLAPVHTNTYMRHQASTSQVYQGLPKLSYSD